MKQIYFEEAKVMIIFINIAKTIRKKKASLTYKINRIKLT